jgi:hypothetical protein
MGLLSIFSTIKFIHDHRYSSKKAKKITNPIKLAFLKAIKFISGDIFLDK